MKKIEDLQAVNDLIAACLKPGVATNCVLTGEDWRRELAAGTLRACQWPGGVLFFRQRDGFWRLSYYVTDSSAAPEMDWPEEDVVMETVLRPRDGAGLSDYWTSLGFVPLFRRLRLKRPGGETEALPPPPAVTAEEAADLLARCFDRRTACLPHREALAAACAAGEILTRRDAAGRLTALLHAAPGRTGTELRHLAVEEDCRGTGLAGDLTAEFVRRFGARNATVWVREDFPQARHIYEKNGFAPDGWTAIVWLKKGRN